MPEPPSTHRVASPEARPSRSSPNSNTTPSTDDVSADDQQNNPQPVPATDAISMQLNQSVFNGPVQFGNRYDQPVSPPHHEKTGILQHWMVNRTANPLFVGRDDIVKRIQEAFTTGEAQPASQPKRYVITGPAGMGKSEICLNVANLLQSSRLGWDGNNLDEARQALARLSENWLMIFDNADDLDVDYLQSLPTGKQGCILIASRNPRASYYATVGSTPLQPLSSNSAQSLLLSAAGVSHDSKGTRTSQDLRDKAPEIVDELGSHTLAITIIGSLIGSGYIDITEFKSFYTQHRKDIHRYAPKIAHSEYGSVYATFDSAAAVLDSLGTTAALDAQSLLLILAHVHYNDFPLDMFKDAWYCGQAIKEIIRPDPAEGDWGVTNAVLNTVPQIIQAENLEWDQFRFQSSINTLFELGLIELNGDFLSVHPLTHEWTQDRLSQEQQRQSWVATCSTFALLSLVILPWWPFKHSEIKMDAPRYIGKSHLHLIQVVQGGRKRIFEDHLSESIWRPLLFGVAKLQAWTYDDTGLEKTLSLISEIADPLDPAFNSEAPHFELVTAENCIQRNQYQYARNRVESVVAHYENTRPKTDPWLLHSQIRLAFLYSLLYDTEKAIALTTQLNSVVEALLPASNPVRLNVKYYTAASYHRNNENNRGIEVLEEAIAYISTIERRDAERLFMCKLLFATMLTEIRPDEAIAVLQELLDTKDAITPGYTKMLIDIEGILGIAYMRTKQLEKAIICFQSLVESQKTTHSKNHPSVLPAQSWLAASYAQAERRDEATDLIEDVREALPSIEDDIERSFIEHGLALVYVKMAEYVKAIDVLEHVVHVKERYFAHNISHLQWSKIELARAYVHTQQYDKATEQLKPVWQTSSTTAIQREADKLLAEALRGRHSERKF